MVFYILWKAYKENPDQYIPAWKFLGEIYIEEINEHVFASYKCPANGVNVYFKNPGLLDRRCVNGKSGAKYFEYRIAPNPSMAKIVDEKLLGFYKRLKP